MSNMTKNAHAPENSVAERRLRAIYDWLDYGNNKKALQECDKVLKKTPKLQCARALKALSLQRMSRNPEALAILDDLSLEDPTDEPTLQAMTLCCREMKRLDRICSLYEKAAKLDPANEEIQTQLFMSHVRIGNFKSQQNVAMALYKHKPKNPYYCWAVMSIILQARRGEGAKDPQKSFVLLSLAERMMVKLIYDNKLEAEQEVQLYIMILECLGKHDEIIKLLDGNLGKKLTSGNIPQMKLKHFKLLKQWNEVNLICKEILLQNVDRWNIWLDYVESVLQLEKSQVAKQQNNGDNNESETIDDNCEKAHEFICRIIENGHENNFSMRGPYLARLELFYEMREAGRNAEELLGDVAELAMEYFRKFGYKPCCVSDLRKYLTLLREEKRAELGAKMIQDVGIGATSVPRSVDQMQRHICALQLSRMLGAHLSLSSEHQSALLTALTLHHKHGHKTYGQGLLSTDLGPADAYALLAAHLLCDLSRNERESRYSLVALALLESLLANSPSNFHAKLLALKINHAIGNTLGAHDMYVSLDVKHLQLDSLGYVHYARMPATGIFSLCPPLYDQTIAFFSANYKDSSDHLTFSYKYGSFLKVDEFMDFRQKLHDSFHYAQTESDRQFLNLVECQSMDAFYKIDLKAREDETPCDLLKDNYDFKVYAAWDPPSEENDDEEKSPRQIFFETSKRYLKVRRAIVRCLELAAKLTSTLDDGERHTLTSDLEKKLRDWSLVESQETSPLPDWPTSRWEAGHKTPYFAILGSLFSLLIDIENNVEKAKIDLEQMKCGLCRINSLLKDSSSNYLPDRRKTLEIIVNCVEVLSVSSLICGLMCDSPSRTKPPNKKGKKKCQQELATSPSQPDSPRTVADLMKESVRTVTEATDCFVQSVDAWRVTCDADDVAALCAALSLDDGNVANADKVARETLESYAHAHKETLAVLRQKFKFLQGLLGQL